MSELTDRVKEVDTHLAEFEKGVRKTGRKWKLKEPQFIASEGWRWQDVGKHVELLEGEKDEKKRIRIASEAISAVIASLTATQRQAWVAQNILESLKRGDSPKSIALNMESAGVVPRNSLTSRFERDEEERHQAADLAGTSNWILSHAKQILLRMAQVLDRVVAAVSAFIRIKPRIGVGLGITPSVDISWEVGDVSVKELVDALIKGVAA